MKLDDIFQVLTTIPDKLDIKSLLSENICLRGFCGEINIDRVLCPLLVKLLQVDDPSVYPFYSSKYECYIKRGCICDKNCSEEEANGPKGCIQDPKKCARHHIIVISPNSSFEIKDNDYILDFTYKQNLYRRLTYNTKEKKEEIEKLPPYLFLSFDKYKNYSSNEEWQKEVATKCFIIRRDACDVVSAVGSSAVGSSAVGSSAVGSSSSSVVASSSSSTAVSGPGAKVTIGGKNKRKSQKKSRKNLRKKSKKSRKH